MIVTVFVSSGLTNAYRSVLSARGSWLISGASEWLDALAALGPGARVRIATSASAPSASAAATTTGLRIRGTAACMGSILPPPVVVEPGSQPGRERFGYGWMRVPVRPSSASPRAAGEVIRASWPVARTNSTRRLDLRPHRAGRELREERLGVVGGELAQLLLLVRAEAGVDRRHLGQDHEPVGAELAREEGGGAVLVDHRVDAREVLAAPRGRDAAAADGDDDRARGEQRADRAELDHLERLRRGHDAPPAAAGVVDDLPAAVALELRVPRSSS